VRIDSILKPECVLAELEKGNKMAVIGQLAQAAAKASRLDKNVLIEVLLGREKLGSTGIGGGIAIPHGKVPGLKNITAVFGRSVAGLEFEALDGKPCQIFFAVLMPADSASGHLKALARVSTLLKSDSLRHKILEAPDAAGIYQSLLEEDALLLE